MIELYERSEDCCGCTACMSICPKDAIMMTADKEGFLYPQIDEALCIECDLCTQVCAFHDSYRIGGNYDQPLVYAAKHRSDEVRMNSSSGGLFTAISDFVLERNGVVYGAAFGKDFEVRHHRAETVEERDRFRGSKYVQSNLLGIYKEVKTELRKGKTVLFTGTPCQNAGLRSFLNKEYEGLYLCDIVCHGTPSPRLFADYIAFCEKKQGSKIKEYYCRYKGNGWHSHTEKAVFANGKEDFHSLLSQAYKSLFYSHVALRPSCHNCKFCNFNRPSDITIADFWGIEKSMPDFDDNKGVSLVLVSSAKGEALLNGIQESIVARQSSIQDCLQHNLQAPTVPSPKREQFWREYETKGFEYVLKKYGGLGYKQRVRRIIRIALDNTGLLPVARKVMGR